MKERIEWLVNTINQANYEYYILDNPALTDQEWDNYITELIALETKYPEFVMSNSPTQRVGTKVIDERKKITHKVGMFSLSNVFNEEDIRLFDQRIKKEINEYSYVCELKIDGLAVSLTYENGKYISAATRGDGRVGEDITHNVLIINSIPKNLPEPITLDIRGEIYMPKKSFNELNEERAVNNLPLFQNPRNAAAGSIRQLDSEITKSRNLDAFLYHVATNLSSSHYENLMKLKQLGFTVNPYIKKCNNIDEVIAYIEEWTKKREELPYEIDGIVIKIDQINNQDILGYTNKYPKWATAYKFPAIEVLTRLEDVIFTVGRTGQITPNAVLDPVKLAGSTIRRATLHNEAFIRERGLKIGDMVYLRKAGDVIPEVIKPKTEIRSGNEREIIMINTCPICDTALILSNTKIDLFCPNKKCPARNIEGLIHFTSQHALNIIGLGEKIIEDFYNLGLIKTFIDIFELKNKKTELIELEGFGNKSVDNLLESIENSKKASLECLLFGIGIAGIGEKNAKIIAKKYKNIDNIMIASEEELNNLNDIGPILATNIVSFFSDKHNIEMIDDLKRIGLNTNYIQSSNQTYEDFNNKKVVITGSLESFKRDELIKIIEDSGGQVSSTVSKNTDILIVGDNPGSKYDNALKLKVLIWNETELTKIIQK